MLRIDNLHPPRPQEPENLLTAKDIPSVPCTHYSIKCDIFTPSVCRLPETSLLVRTEMVLFVINQIHYNLVLLLCPNLLTAENGA